MAPGLPHEFITQYRLLLRRLHEAKRSAAGATASPWCEKGCSACCTGPFDVGLADLLLLMEALSTLPDRVRRDVLARIRSEADTQRQALGDSALSPITIEGVGEARFDDMCDSLATRRCPFLDPDSDHCVVAADRPEPCLLRGARWRIAEEELDMRCPDQPEETELHPTLDLAPLHEDIARLEAREKRGNLCGDDRTTIALGLDTLLRASALD